MPITRMWYSNPSPFCWPYQFDEETVRDVILEHADEDGGTDTERPKPGENSKDEQESAEAFDDHEDTADQAGNPIP